MNFFSKIFGSYKNNPASSQVERSKYMPEEKTPIDELFTINFKKNGGKFLYCEDKDEALALLNNILDENDWKEKPLLTLDKNMALFCSNAGYETTHKTQGAGVFFTSCEHLIALNGSILVSDSQFGENKLPDLPEIIIVFAKTSQMLETIQDGLKQIKKNYPKQIPGNITAIKNFKKETEGQKDFMSYGSSNKDVYLILLEDL